MAFGGTGHHFCFMNGWWTWWQLMTFTGLRVSSTNHPDNRYVFRKSYRWYVVGVEGVCLDTSQWLIIPGDNRGLWVGCNWMSSIWHGTKRSAALLFCWSIRRLYFGPRWLSDKSKSVDVLVSAVKSIRLFSPIEQSATAGLKRREKTLRHIFSLSSYPSCFSFEQRLHDFEIQQLLGRSVGAVLFQSTYKVRPAERTSKNESIEKNMNRSIVAERCPCRHLTITWV